MHINRRVSFAEQTSLGVGGPAWLWCAVYSDDDIRSACDIAQRLETPVQVIGDGTNMLCADGPWDGIVMRVNCGDSVRIRWDVPGYSRSPDRVIEVHAGCDWDFLVRKCTGRGLQGIECLSGIPGTVGAAPVQNIGAYGQEVSRVIEWVSVIDLADGRLRRMTAPECMFGYRSSIFNRPENRNRYVITGVALRLQEGAPPCLDHTQLARGRFPMTLDHARNKVIALRRAKGMLALQHKSAGSFFKNPVMSSVAMERLFPPVALDAGYGRWWWTAGQGCKVSAAWLIEQAGLHKGYTRGRAGISPQHSLAIVNLGGATAAEIVNLACHIQESVFKCFGILLEPEVQLVGFEKYPLKKWPD